MAFDVYNVLHLLQEPGIIMGMIQKFNPFRFSSQVHTHMRTHTHAQDTHTHTHADHTHTTHHTHHTHTHTHTTHTHTHTHTQHTWFLWFTGTLHRRNGFLYCTSCMCYCPTPTLHLNLALTGDVCISTSPPKKLTLYDL